MVARDEVSSDAAPPLPARVAALFLAWRRAVTAAVAGSLRAVTAVPRALAGPAAWARLLSTFVAHPSSAGETARERRFLALAGLLSLAIAIPLSFLLAKPLGVPLPAAAVAALWTAGWAGLRLGILRVAAAPVSPSAVRVAWAAGLLPSVAGLTDPLRVVVLAASAWLTFGALMWEATDRRAASRAIAWAFGAEIAGALLRWLGSGLLLYALAR